MTHDERRDLDDLDDVRVGAAVVPVGLAPLSGASPSIGSMHLGLSIPTFDEPGPLVELGCTAEEQGWDGAFYWHHTMGTPAFPAPMADTWVLLGALAVRTERIRLGTMVTALPRHQPQETARQAVTVDRLSGGRLVLGVGLGEPPTEFTALGRSADRSELAARLDESLAVLAGLWTGQPFSHRGEYYSFDDVQFLPTPLQRPRIPIWASAMVRNEHTLGRAARWDGAILGAMSDSGVGTLPAEAVAEVAARPDAPTDIVVAAPVGADLAAYRDAGATWVVIAGWLDELREIAAGPPPVVART